MKNNKGFTMVELLAVITILGLLVGIGVVSVQKSNQRARDNFYKTQRSTLTNAATSYLADHKSEYPTYIGQDKNITLGTLQTNKYIGKFTDHSKAENSCNPNNTIVKVIKTDTNRFTYRAILKCNGITDKDVTGLGGTHHITKNANYLSINVTAAQGYKIKKYSYVVYKTGTNIVIRTNTVTPSTPDNNVTATVNIKDISSKVGKVEVYYITLDGSFGKVVKN